MDALSTVAVDTPLGRVHLYATDSALVGAYFEGHRHAPVLSAQPGDRHPVLTQARHQLAEYVAGRRRGFDLPLAMAGTPFQRRVWALLREIPFGRTWTYGQLAERLGAPDAARAVGAAVGRNPISIVVPCHRVVGQRGQLTGYAGGTERKRWLLEHEGVAAGHS